MSFYNKMSHSLLLLIRICSNCKVLQTTFGPIPIPNYQILRHSSLSVYSYNKQRFCENVSQSYEKDGRFCLLLFITEVFGDFQHQIDNVSLKKPKFRI